MPGTIANLAVQLSLNAQGYDAALDKAASRTEQIGRTLASMDLSKGAADSAATFLQLRASLDKAQSALNNFKGAGGGEALQALQANYKTAKKALSDFAESQRTAWDKFSSGAVRAASVAGKAISTIKGAVSGVLDTMDHLPIVGKVFAATQFGNPRAMIETITENIKEMAAMTRQAERMGISVNSLVAIQVAAGGAADAMEKGMFRLAKTLGEAASGGETAIKTLARLGFAEGELAGMPLDKSLAVIADKFASLSDPTQKALMAFELFGKTGFELIPVLSRGSAGLADAAKKADRFGLSLSTLEAAGVTRAAKALRDIDLLVKGIQRSLAIEMAPIVGLITEKFVQWKTAGGNMREVFHDLAAFLGRMLAGLAEFLDTAIDSLHDLINELRDLKGLPGNLTRSAASAFGGAGHVIDARQMLQDAGANLSGPQAKSSMLRDLADQLRNLGDFAKNALTPAQQLEMSLEGLARISRFFGAGGLAAQFDRWAQSVRNAGNALPDERVLKLAEDIGELQNKLQGQVAEFGRSGEALEVFKLKQRGATDAQLEQANALVKQIDLLKRLTDEAAPGLNIYDQFRARADALLEALQKGRISAEGYAAAFNKIYEALQKSAASKAAEVLQNTATPLEKAKAQIEELQGLFNAHLISQDVYLRGIGKTAADLEGILKSAEAQHPAAVQFGSQEAIKLIAENQDRNSPSNDPVARLQEAIRVQTEIQKMQLEQAKRIEEAIKQGRLKVLGGV